MLSLSQSRDISAYSTWSSPFSAALGSPKANTSGSQVKEPDNISLTNCVREPLPDKCNFRVTNNSCDDETSDKGDQCLAIIYFTPIKTSDLNVCICWSHLLTSLSVKKFIDNIYHVSEQIGLKIVGHQL